MRKSSLRLFKHSGNPANKCVCGHARSSHGQDLPWDRCGNTACKHLTCECDAFVSPDRKANKPTKAKP